ncbi:MAG TPA: MFS transporter, partial [Mycobacterium sp.]|nr:MFS transporter [Mycobacterium sp.]
VAGSVLAERYANSVAPRLESVPEPLRARTTDSPGQALQMAGALGVEGERIREAAVAAFVTATHTAALVLAVIAAGAAAWVAWRARKEGLQKC